MEWWADAWDNWAKLWGYDSWQWGTAADWVAAVGTTGALLIALWVLKREQIDTKRVSADRVAISIDERWSDSVTDGTGNSLLVIENRNEASFPYVELYGRLAKPRVRPDSIFATHPTTNGEDISPKEVITETVRTARSPKHRTILVAVLCDERGRKWYRDVLEDRYISEPKYRRFVHGVRIPFVDARWYFNP